MKRKVSLISKKLANRCISIARSMAPEPRKDIRNSHFTFMVRKGTIMSIGMNNPKTNTKNVNFNYVDCNNENIGNEVMTHSEMSSVVKFGEKDCSDIVFVNIRLDRNGNLNNSCPCRGCKSLLESVGYKKVFYSTKNGDFEELC